MNAGLVLRSRKNQFENEMKRLDSIKLKPVKETNAKVEEMGFKPLTDAVTAKEFLRRPEVSYQDVVASSDQQQRTWMTRLSN